MRYFFSSSVILWLMLMSGGAQAAPLKIVGFEDMSCRAWVSSKSDAETRLSYLSWVRGALTGHNYANQKQQVSALSNGTVENFVNAYCAENPKADFSEAALRMSDRFSGRNQAITK